jgi:hypothetical protein
MLRTTVIGFATAAALGTSLSSAAPLNGAAIAAAGNAAPSVQQVWWFRQRRYRPSAAARMQSRDEVCYLRGRRGGDPHLFMRQQARGCF